MRENEEVIKKKIKNDLKNEDLNEILKGLICFLILSIVFGYIGFIFCRDNNYDVQRGIIFGVLFSIGLSFLKAMNYGKLAYIVYTIIYLAILEYIPTFIGILLIFIMILVFIIAFIVALKKDRSEEIERLYREEYRFKRSKKARVKNNTECKEKIKNETKNLDIELPKETLYCERCFKEISEEEYELYDGMCEECFDESHYDFNGNPRDDYWNY